MTLPYRFYSTSFVLGYVLCEFCQTPIFKIFLKRYNRFSFMWILLNTFRLVTGIYALYSLNSHSHHQYLNHLFSGLIIGGVDQQYQLISSLTFILVISYTPVLQYVFDNTVAKFLGKISFSLYLTHTLTLNTTLVTSMWMENQGMDRELVKIIGIFLFFVNSCLVAWLFWFFFERWAIFASKKVESLLVIHSI